MKYLNAFFNYIKESKSIDKDEISSMLLPLYDMGLSISYFEGTSISVVSTDDKNHNRKFIRVVIDLSRLNKSDIILDGFRRRDIDDDRFWEVLDEIISLRGRLIDSGASNCLFNFIQRESYSAISITIMGDKEDKSDEVILNQLRSQLKSKLNSMSTDFSYNTIVSLVKSGSEWSVEVKSDSIFYTDRKFNNLLRGIDMSEFNIKKILPDSRFGDVINIITIKK